MGRIKLIVLALLFSVSISVQSQIIKVACIGNSITYGSGLQNRDKQSYPAQLQFWLGKNYDVKNFGVSGATLLKNGNKPYWDQQAFTNAKDFLPDIVIIKLGTNDSKPVNWSYAEEFSSNYKELISIFKSLPSRPRILIATPVPVFTEEKWGISRAVVRDEILPMVKEIANSTHCDLVDLYSTCLNQGRFFPDHVHPDPLGAEMMVEEIYIKLFHKTSANHGTGFNTAIHPVPSPEYRGASAGWGEGKDWFSQHDAINQIGDDRQVDLVFLGNSITQSWGGEGREVWAPVKDLWDSLYSPRNAANFGISGDRTQHILWRIENGNFDKIKPKAIVLTIGVNNFRGNTATEIAAGITLIIKKLRKKLPSAKILLLGPLPAGKDSADPLRKQFLAVHKQIRKLGVHIGVSYYCIDKPFINDDGSLNYELMRTDNIHLAPKGYELWSQKIEPELVKIFSK
ncbi:MAG: hypothetical protein HN936_00080 [Bacteroidetes bacterium]|nr:hypothetical protein [Bacteroidota bacterium]MBT7091608.1 hypothetical protein [Bacteroidota bacterium]